MAHIHDVYDQDNHFIIDPITRDITSQSEKISITQYDHNSERFTFEIPKIIEGHDMSLSDKVRVHFINIGSNRSNVSKGVYEVDDIRVSSDDSDTLLFSWLISRAATEYSGKLNFSIRFYCISDDNIVDYSWATSIFTGIKISNSIDNSEAIAEDYVDILEQWKSEIAIKIDDIDSKIENIKTPEIPTQLPNPQSLTFTGAVNASYDGSSEVSVRVPGALSDLSEDATHRVVTDTEKAKWNEKITAPVTGEVGQTIRIKTVDYTGRPIEWETVDASKVGVQFTTDETLSLKDGVLSVNTAQEPEPDNTLPITSAAVHTAVGNIEIILQTI